MDVKTIQSFFSGERNTIDVESIINNFLAIEKTFTVDHRKLPLPVWARRGLSDDGDQAWKTIQADAAKKQNPNDYCIYLHVPFCKEKCVFCDCYSFRLANHQEAIIEKYLNALALEMGSWNRLGAFHERKLSTVHLGGGTPTFLGDKYLTQLVMHLRDHFQENPNTEWALESTSSELDENMLSLLDQLGFTRLHVGVQSLEDRVRHTITRRESSVMVLEKLKKMIARGWVVSIDLICGLPQQSIQGWLNDIQALAQIGVDGFSIYELQVTSNNRRFAQINELPADRSERYLYFQAAEQSLYQLGYHKTLFNHFAREKDTNLYFTFPERGEDCLAMGTIADGVMGDYHFRHPQYKKYLDLIDPFFPGLQGGLRRSALENKVRPLETALLSGNLSLARFDLILGKERSGSLFQFWLNNRLIQATSQAGQFLLTANGSWFVGEMMNQMVQSGQTI